jgi:hypothetical protein
MAAAIAATLDAPPAAAVLEARADHFSIDRAVDRYAALLFGDELSARARC